MFLHIIVAHIVSFAFLSLEDDLFGAFRTENVRSVGDEFLADQSGAAASALEAIIVPMAVLERDESSATNACANVEYKLTRRIFDNELINLKIA